MLCHVSWPLKALCHRASRKRSQQWYNNNKVCYVGGRLGCRAPVWVCTLQMHARVCPLRFCVKCSCVWTITFTCMWKSLHVSASLPLLFGCVESCQYCLCICVCASAFVLSVKTFMFILIFLSENVFHGLKCQLSTVNLCILCSVWWRGKQTVLICCCLWRYT